MEDHIYYFLKEVKERAEKCENFIVRNSLTGTEIFRIIYKTIRTNNVKVYFSSIDTYYVDRRPYEKPKFSVIPVLRGYYTAELYFNWSDNLTIELLASDFHLKEVSSETKSLKTEKCQASEIREYGHRILDAVSGFIPEALLEGMRHNVNNYCSDEDIVR